MTSTVTRESARRADGRTVALFLACTIALGIVIPCGGLLAALAATLTALKTSPRALALIWTVAALLALAVVLPYLGEFISPVATGSDPEVVG